MVAVQDSNRAALTTPVGRVSNQPSGLLLSPRFPTPRNVYQERCRQTIRSGDFFRGGRYRTRTARHRRRRGNKHPSGVFVSARFPTARNVYQERCRQTIRSGGFFSWWAVQDSNSTAPPQAGQQNGPAPANSTKPGTFSGPTAQKGFRVSVWMGCTAARGAFYLLVYPSMPCSAGS